MKKIFRLILVVLVFFPAHSLFAQTIVKGKIIDALTKEPLAGASVHCSKQDCSCGCSTNALGEFQLSCTDCESLTISSIGYATQKFSVKDVPPFVVLQPATSLMQGVVVSASRGESMRRSQAPVAITSISSRVLQDTKPATADQVLNKVSGVNMVNLGNEQHQMSIRQPMTTKSLFLYLEDGIPVRTTGLYNHNALLEMNMAATKSIEVIKGPSSSLYGSEAIGGVVNFITVAPAALPVLKLSTQGNNIGYKRVDLMSSLSKGKWGFALNGYYADKRNGFLEYTDYHKATWTARVDYRFSKKTSLSNSMTWLTYYSDMAGGIDSAMFAGRSFKNPQTFTYRKVDALRYRSTLTQQWNGNSKTTVSALYRNNTIEQNPAYRVKDDYRKINGVFTGQKNVAHGEINDSRFNSYSVIAQHRQNFAGNKAVVIGGLSVDLSPSSYEANYIRIKKDSITNRYTDYRLTDSVLTNYATKLNNYAAFMNVEFSPLEKLRLVASLRYDLFHYDFDNHLKPSAFSGSPDTVNRFSRFSPKIGFTYNFSSRTGLYANYSEGFVPPQVSELYTGVKVPNINPSVFYNYEIGGWFELVKNKLSADISIYKLDGTNEIISVKLDDGSFANRNAGKTTHKGVELGLYATPVKDLSIRFTGAWSRHRFVDYIEKGTKYNGREMSNAPTWIYNVEGWYKPAFVKGLRIGAEWQHVGRYFADPQNTSVYKGYDVLNLRAGYQLKCVEFWLNVLNATDSYYAYIATKSSSGYSYQLAEPRNFNAGISIDIAGLLKTSRQ